MQKITSLQNPKIKNLQKLAKARERKTQEFIVIEGRHEIFLAQAARINLKELYYCPDFASDNNFAVKTEGVEVIELDKAVFKKISQRERPDGYIALAKPRYLELESIKLPKNPLILVLDRIEKPGNLGAIFRTADGAGVDLVLVSDAKTDIFNPNVIRSSLGTVFTNKIVLCSAKNAQAWLKSKEIFMIATTPNAEKAYFDFNLRQALAIVVGTEHEGLGENWLNFVDGKAVIPMKGRIDSLNASVSSAVALYEALRQRVMKKL